MWALKRNGNGKEQTDDPLPQRQLTTHKSFPLREWLDEVLRSGSSVVGQNRLRLQKARLTNDVRY